ncbi:unnamed protein product [Chrysoparadoxa australica]
MRRVKKIGDRGLLTCSTKLSNGCGEYPYSTVLPCNPGLSIWDNRCHLLRGMPLLKDWLGEAPFSLCLSSSFFGMWCHAGVLAALCDRGLAPSKVSGSSSGALIACWWSTTRNINTIVSTLASITENPLSLCRLFHPNPWPGLVSIYTATKSFVRDHFPVQRFESCDPPAFVSAWDPYRMRNRVFCEEGDLVPALAASMAVPFLFKPCLVNGAPHWDGAVSDMAGVCGLSRDDRVLYHHATVMPVGLTPHISQFKNLVTLKLEGLPYLHPLRLGRAMEAFHIAREATLICLDSPLPEQPGQGKDRLVLRAAASGAARSKL